MSCKKTSPESPGCSSSPIGQKKIFFGQSEAGNWNWFGKSKCPGARLDLTVNFHHGHFIDPTNCPWVSEDVHKYFSSAQICFSVHEYIFQCTNM